MTGTRDPNAHRAAGVPWTPEDDERIRSFATNRIMEWSDIAKVFPGRTPFACRQRWSLLKARDAGTEPKPRAHYDRATKGKRMSAGVAAERLQPPVDPGRAPKHTSLTAELCGDPLPGRSALDQKQGPTA